jgi:hypothetical protein
LQFWHEATPDHQLGAYRTKDGAPNRTAPGTVPHKKQFLAEQMVSLTVAVAASHGAKFAAIYISKKIVFLLHYYNHVVHTSEFLRSMAIEAATSRTLKRAPPHLGHKSTIPFILMR